MNRCRSPLGMVAVPIFVVFLSAGCAARSWPQWGGPDRNFSTSSAGLSTNWPAEGPKKLWSRPLGDGFSTIVTDGQTLYTTYRKDAKDPNEVIAALKCSNGETLWEYRYAAPYLGQDEKEEEKRQTTEFSSGPNSTPLLVNGKLITIGFTGKMNCLDAKSGKIIWSHDITTEYGSTFLMFGYASSPIAYGNLVIAVVGGKGHAVMAFDQATGKVVWQNGDYACSYSSPTMMKVEGEDHLIAYLAGDIVGMSPKTGEIQWHLQHKNSSNDNSICTPIAGAGNALYFVNFGDSAGGKMVRLAHRDGHIQPVEVWANKKLQGGLSDVVRVGDYFYGANGGLFMIGFNAANGQIVWQERGYPRAKVVSADGKLVILDEEGRLAIVTPSPGGMTLHAKAQVLENPARSAPTLVGTRMYLRDKKTIMAVDLSEKI